MMRFWFPALMTCLFISGCSSSDDKWKDKRPKTVLASGVVLLDGKPLAAAQVVCVTDGAESSTGASGLSDEEGRFVLSAFPPDPGAIPGSYKVMVVKANVPEVQAVSEDVYTPPTKAVLLVPVRYTSPDKSGLTATIPDGGTSELKFELTQ